METDFSALASRIAASDDVLGCLILSADGVVLGAFPPVDDRKTKPAWLKFAALGTPRRGFIQMSESELWAYTSSGPYAAFAVATASTRPGVLLDHLEQALLVAGESRDRRDVVQAPQRVDLSDTQPLQAVSRPAAVSAALAWMDTALGGGAATIPREELVGAESSVANPVTPGKPPIDSDSEVDRVALAREFAGLLQDDRPGVEEPV